MDAVSGADVAAAPAVLAIFRRNLKCPRKNQRHRKAEDDDDDKYLHHPWRRVEGRKENRRRLKQEPGNNRIRDRHFVNVAPLQLGEKVVDLHEAKMEKPL